VQGQAGIPDVGEENVRRFTRLSVGREELPYGARRPYDRVDRVYTLLSSNCKGLKGERGRGYRPTLNSGGGVAEAFSILSQIGQSL